MGEIDKTSIAVIVYEKIVQMIFDGVYPPGASLTRRTLAEELNVSPTPVGEAIARLIGEGIIEYIDRSNYRVKVFSKKDLASLYAARAGFEGIAVRLCIENAADSVLNDIAGVFENHEFDNADRIDESLYRSADFEFHGSIVKNCGNQYIVDFCRSAGYQLSYSGHTIIRPPSETISEHRELSRLIRAREGHPAQDLLIEHHMLTVTRLQSESGPELQ